MRNLLIVGDPGKMFPAVKRQLQSSTIPGIPAGGGSTVGHVSQLVRE